MAEEAPGSLEVESVKPEQEPPPELRISDQDAAVARAEELCRIFERALEHFDALKDAEKDELEEGSSREPLVPVPASWAELQKLKQDGTERYKNALARREALIKAAKEKADSAARFKGGSMSDIAAFGQEVASAIELLKSAREEYLAAQRLRQDLSLAIAAFEKQELGRSGFGSRDELENETDSREEGRWRISKQISDISRRKFGLGKLFHRREVMEKTMELANFDAETEHLRVLRNLRYFQEDFPSESYGYWNEHELTVQLGRTFWYAATEVMDKELAAAGAVADAKVEPLPAERIREMSDKYADKVISEEVAPRVMSDPKLAKDAEQILARSRELLQQVFDTRAVFYIGEAFRGNEEREAQMQKAEDLKKEIKKLPWAAYSVLDSHWSRGFDSNGKKFETYHELVEKKRMNEARSGVAERYLRLLNSLDKLPGVHGSEYKKRGVEQASRTSGLEELIANFDPERWRIYCEANGGDPMVQETDGFLSREVLRRLMNTPEHTNESIGLGMTLWRGFDRPELVPVKILNAFRESGHSGERPFNPWGVDPSQNMLVKLASSFGPDKLEELEALHIPGLIEVVSLIRKYPGRYYLSGDSEASVREEIDGHLSRMALHVLKQDPSALLFVLECLAGRQGSLDEEGYALLADAAGRQASFDNPEAVARALLTRYRNGDLRAPEILFKNSAELQHDWARNFAAEIAVSESGLTPENLAGISEIFGLPTEKVEKAIGTIRRLQKIDSGHWALAGSVANHLEELCAAADEEEFFELVGVLSEYGYSFNLEHLPKIREKSREAGLTDRVRTELQKLRAAFPGYSHSSYRDLFLFEPLREFALLGTGPVERDIVQSLNGVAEITPENWERFLILHLALEYGRLPVIDAGTLETVKAQFAPANREGRDICLRGMRSAYRDLLSGGLGSCPPEAIAVLGAIRDFEGAGSLKYVGILGELGWEVWTKMTDPALGEVTKKELTAGLLKQEDRLDKERWDEDERAVYYKASQEMLQAAPLAFREFFGIFDALRPKQLKFFAEELMPMYQTELFLAKDAQGEADSADMLGMQKRLAVLADRLGGSENDAAKLALLKEARQAIAASIEERFREKFGIIKVPEMDEQALRAVRNFSRYLANLNGRNEASEHTLSLFLGLALNGEWDAFREGREVDLPGIFDAERVPALRRLVEERDAANILTAENLGVGAEDLPKFREMLQAEELAQRLGSAETIDVKLGGLLLNLAELGDEDVYPEGKQRELFRLCRRAGKSVGASLAKGYERSRGKKIELTAEEAEILDELRTIYGFDELTSAGIKTIQDEVKSLGFVANILRAVETGNVQAEITRLRDLLQPSPEVVAVFSRLGENFEPGSGALALSQDLSYLENIVVKESHNLSSEEQGVLREYLQGIRAQMQSLEENYRNLTEQVGRIQAGIHQSGNPILTDRVAEISKMLGKSEAPVEIVSRMTSDLNLIVENMRQCLGCLTPEVNNDTNLTFGEPYKFYLMSQSPGSPGSLADEIAFLCPVENSDGEKGMGFVLDQVYGSKSGDILASNLLAVLKKVNRLKKAFPGARLSVLVSREAMSSVGLSGELLLDKLGKDIKAHRTDIASTLLTVTVPKSALGDHYVEFGSGAGARTAGERRTEGLLIA